MSAPFLVQFVQQVVNRLLERGEIEIAAGRTAEVVRDVAGGMSAAGQGHQAVSTLSRALLAHPAVDELYIDDQDIKELIGDLGTGWTRLR